MTKRINFKYGPQDVTGKEIEGRCEGVPIVVEHVASHPHQIRTIEHAPAL